MVTAIGWILVGIVIALMCMVASAVFGEGKSEDQRKAKAALILRDLLMLQDIDPTVVLPGDYRRRIERWLKPADGTSDYWVATGRCGTDAGSYRDVAKLISDLVHPPLDEPTEIPVLPSTIQTRCNSWLASHRKALGA